MPRMTYSPADQHEQRWTALAHWLGEELLFLRHGRQWHLRARGGNWVMRLERQGDHLEAAVHARFRRSLRPEQEVAILDLGWGPRRHEFVVMWEPEPVPERPVGVLGSLVFGRRDKAEWISPADRRDAADLLVATITGPLEVIDTGDIHWDLR